MKLTVHDSLADQVGTDVLRYDKGVVPTPFKSEETVSTGYTDVTSIVNWDLLWTLTGIKYKALRNTLITDHLGSWGTLGDSDKKILVRHHVWPSGTSTADLDALWTYSERNAFRSRVIEGLSCRHVKVRKSTTTNSEKLFVSQIDDTGVDVITELSTFAVLV